MNHFLVFSIGPVQDFIATARRTQDLWMGSRILSYLSSRAMSTVRVAGAELLFPPTDTTKTDHGNLPNKFVARITADQANDVGDLAKSAELAAHDEWRRIARDVLQKFQAAFAPDDDWQEIWQRQIGDLLEVFWCVAPESSDYAASFRLAQRGFEARKGLRNFGKGEEGGEKCTVCGQRSALHVAFNGSGSQRQQVRDYWTKVAAAVRAKKAWRSALKPDGAERLCAVCTVKRVGRDALGGQPGFPSTSDIAVASFQSAVVNALGDPEMDARARDQLKKALKDHLDTLALVGEGIEYAKTFDSVVPMLREGRRRLHNDVEAFLLHDGDVLYSETFTVKRVEDSYGVTPTEADCHDAAQSSNALRRAASHAKIPPPPKYYAILQMDGDHLGVRLNAASDADTHRAISTALTTFAEEGVPRVLHLGHPGCLVYAGGDDGLALLPIDHALAGANELRQAFASALPGFTASVGLAFAHHTQPLDGALAAARRAQAAAKELYGRNALAVHFLKRSGEELRVGVRWAYGDLNTVDLLADLQQRFADERLSMKFPYAVLDEARFLPQQAWCAELLRLLKRQSGAACDKKQRDEQAAELAPKLSALALGLDEHRLSWQNHWQETYPGRKPAPIDEAEAPQPGMVELSRWLTLVRFLAKGGGDE
jgi:CRISPR-associated protein Cmr2